MKDEYIFPAPDTNLDIVESLSNITGCSRTNEIKKPPQFDYGNEPFKFVSTPPSKLKNKQVVQKHVRLKENAEETETNLKCSPKLDHVYEEVNPFQCDIMDYYEKYSPTTAKTLINTLFLPRHKICKQCANSQNSPIYSDQLIYENKQVLAKEIHLFQSNDTVPFKYCPENRKNSTALFSQYDNVQHCLLVYNYSKTNASSIFYFSGPPRDVFDLRATLKPNIVLLNNDALSTANTELYHRCASNFYTRISKTGIEPTFSINHNNILSTIKHIGYDTDLQNWMNYRNDVSRSHGLKRDDTMEHRANRSSLLLLEPLLLMPELTSPRYRHGKNRISQSEHMKVVKIVIAYTLSFFILATITFYIVYFT